MARAAKAKAKAKGGAAARRLLGEIVPVPQGINAGLRQAGNAYMLSLFGNPRSSYSQNCQPVTNKALARRIKRGTVGKLRVMGLDSAIADLQSIMAEIQTEHPDVYAALGTAGMLCARNIRGSSSAISNHAWGTAIDLTINGKLLPLGVRGMQRGLAMIVPIFNRHKWYSGAGFSRCDSMHFEASRELALSWHSGELNTIPVANNAIQMGDRGQIVAKIQAALNKQLGEKLAVDGVFGVGTRAALIAFQARKNLSPDGIAGPMTLDELGVERG